MALGSHFAEVFKALENLGIDPSALGSGEIFMPGGGDLGPVYGPDESYAGPISDGSTVTAGPTTYTSTPEQIEAVKQYGQAQGWYDPQQGITNPQALVLAARQFGIPVEQVTQALGVPPGRAEQLIKQAGYGNLLDYDNKYSPAADAKFSTEDIKGIGSKWMNPEGTELNKYGLLSDIINQDIPLSAFEEAYGLPEGTATTWMQDQGLASLVGLPQPDMSTTGGGGILGGVGNTGTPGVMGPDPDSGYVAPTLPEVTMPGGDAGGGDAGGGDAGGGDAGGGDAGGGDAGGGDAGGGDAKDTLTGGTGDDTTKGGTAIEDEIDPSKSTVSESFGPYINKMLGKIEALADTTYTPYTKERVAGFDPLQTKAFTALDTFDTTPEGYSTAANTIKDAISKYENMEGYKATPVTYDKISSTYKTPDAYKSTVTFDAGYDPNAVDWSSVKYTAPEKYKSAAFDTGLGKVLSVNEYMNPYQQLVTDIEKRELDRQAEIQRNKDQARLTQAGAYGGSRQAIIDAERSRNLMQQMGDIQNKGSKDAYDRALAQRLAESDKYIDVQKATEQSRQYGYTGEMTAADRAYTALKDVASARDAANQFAANKRLEAQKAAEEQSQYGYGKSFDAAKLAADYDITAAKENQAAGIDVGKFNEMRNLDEFNAGLNLLRDQLGAGKDLASLTTTASDQELKGIKAILEAGGIKQGQEQKGLDVAYQDWVDSQKYPIEMIKLMQSGLSGMPVAAVPYDSGDSDIGAIISGIMTGLGTYGLFNPTAAPGAAPATNTTAPATNVAAPATNAVVGAPAAGSAVVGAPAAGGATVGVNNAANPVTPIKTGP